jgi:DNA-binding winged helix-turn-helix (wHTH) protein/tetratricopeptide (TPR) repeat protein
MGVEGTVYRFGAFILDPGRRRLSRDGAPVAITAKAFDALVHLVERAGQTVPRSELARALWPAVVVEDNNLSQTILALRRALGPGDGQFILTIPRSGYRFVADVEPGLPAPPIPSDAPSPGAPPPAPPGPWRARWRWRWLALAGAGMSGAVLLSWGLASRPSPPPSNLALQPTGTASMVAYGHYLKAISLYRAQGGIGVSLAPQARARLIAFLDEALQADPAFPAALGWRAHAELDALLFDPAPEQDWAGYTTTHQARVERLALEALKGDPGLGIAHTTLARLAMYRGRFDDAREPLRKSLESSPQDSMVFHYSAMLHCLREEHEQAIRAARRALELDPRNPAPWSPLVLALLASGDRDGAVAAARRMVDTAPAAAIGYVVLARTQSGGDEAARIEARQSLRIGEQFLDELRNFRVDAALSYASAGERTEATRLARQFRERTQGVHVDPALDAMAHVALGDYDSARERLEYAIRNRALGMDPMSLLLLRRNAWQLRQLETPAWRELRARL